MVFYSLHDSPSFVADVHSSFVPRASLSSSGQALLPLASSSSSVRPSTAAPVVPSHRPARSSARTLAHAPPRCPCPSSTLSASSPRRTNEVRRDRARRCLRLQRHRLGRFAPASPPVSEHSRPPVDVPCRAEPARHRSSTGAITSPVSRRAQHTKQQHTTVSGAAVTSPLPPMFLLFFLPFLELPFGFVLMLVALACALPSAFFDAISHDGDLAVVVLMV